MVFAIEEKVEWRASKGCLKKRDGIIKRIDA
jgi:hypothetical protein